MPYSSSIQVVNDANGTAYAFLADNGVIWQCQWNGEAQRWDKGQPVPGAVGGEKLQALVLSNLWPTESGGSSGNATTGNNPGIVLAYRVGEGSGAEIVASLGQWGSDGQLAWSAPVQLTDDQVEDQAFSLVEGKGGGFSLVVQKQKAGTPVNALLDKLANTPADRLEAELKVAASDDRPDSDLYATQFAIAADTSGGHQLNDLTAGRSQPLSPTLPFSSIASSPRAFSGNTQLSRQQLITQPAQSLSAGPMLALQSSEPTSPAGVSWKWQGGAAGQANFSNGGALRVGLLVGQNILRWQLPAQNRGDLAATLTINNTSGSFFLPGYGNIDVVGGDGDLMLSEVGQTTDQLLNPGARSLSRDSEGTLFFSFVDDPEADGRATPGYQWTGSGGNPVHTGLVLKGVFGLLNTGSGGPVVVSSAKFGYEKGNNDRQNLAKEAARKDGGEFTQVRSGNEIGIGGQLVTVYQYQGKGMPHLVELKTAESVGIDGEHTSLSFSETGGSLVLNGAVSTGWIFEQELVAKQGESLPNAWAWIGYLGGLFADLEKNYITQGVLRKQEGFLGGGVGVVRPLEIQGISPSYFRGGNALDNMSSAIGNNHARLQYLNATVGVILAAIGPAYAFAAATDKDDTSSQNPVANLLFSHSQGLNLWTRLTGRYLWKSVAGLQFTVANKLTKLLTGNEKGAGSDDFFANMGIALPLGSSIPLLSYSFSKSWGGG